MDLETVLEQNIQFAAAELTEVYSKSRKWRMKTMSLGWMGNWALGPQRVIFISTIIAFIFFLWR